MTPHMIKNFAPLIILLLGLAAGASAQPDLTLSTATSPPDCIYICPAGDGQSLTGITVILVDASGAPVVGYPRTQIWADAVNVGELTYCSTPFLANAPTDANGMTIISGTVAGGGHTQLMTVYVGGSPLVGSPLNITVVSPDIDGDHVVDLCDLDLFAADLAGAYDYRSDFSCDGVVNLQDIALLNNHYCHACPGFTYGSLPSSGEVGIFFDTAGTQSGILGVPVVTPFNFYVVALSAPGGIAAYDFGIDVDSRVTLLSRTVHPNGMLTLGGLTETLVGTGGNCIPAAGPSVLATYSAIITSTDLSIPICLRGSNSSCLPSHAEPTYVACTGTCDWRVFNRAYQGCAVINGDGPVAAEQRSWGAIKSLYGN